MNFMVAIFWTRPIDFQPEILTPVDALYNFTELNTTALGCLSGI